MIENRILEDCSEKGPTHFPVSGDQNNGCFGLGITFYEQLADIAVMVYTQKNVRTYIC